MLWKTLETKLTTLAETQKLPDSIIRAVIRRRCAAVAQHQMRGDCETRQQRMNQWLEEIRQSPLAIHTDTSKQQHYEVPAEFFAASLGPARKYSCCYYPTGHESLAQAEQLALAETVERAQLEDGMNILELGCGWGSLTLYMAAQFPNATITAVSHSHSQRQTIEALAAERNLHNVNVITEDMRVFEPPEMGHYDRVVSIEMFEHMRNYQLLLQRISAWLKPMGKLFVHIFCHHSAAYPYVSSGPNDWMTNHFFTGGMMPSDDLLHNFQEHLKLEQRWRWNGKHYQKTCAHWLENMDKNKASIRPLFDAVYGPDANIWWQRWRLFFMSCAEFFGIHDGNEWWVAHYLFSNRRS